MIETYLLEELAVFSKAGTLAKTAEQLNVTQPTVTRACKIGRRIWCTVIDRQPNQCLD